jgi:hypothetical protein
LLRPFARKLPLTTCRPPLHAQMLNVSLVGQEPDLITAQEDTRLLIGPAALRGEAWGPYMLCGGAWDRRRAGRSARCLWPRSSACYLRPTDDA